MGQRSAGTDVQANQDQLMTLARRPDLPARVRSLLEGTLERAAGEFEAAVTRALDELEQELFKLAERSRSNEQQHARFEALREIKRGRADVAPRFLMHVESTLASVGRRAKKPSAAAQAAPGEALELVDSDVLEEDLALQEISSKAEIRHSQALYALAHRFGVLAASPAWDIEKLPLGPAELMHALRHSARGFDLDVEYRVLFYRVFDRVAMPLVGNFYGTLNDYLAGHRILAHLQGPAPRAREASAAADEAAVQKDAAEAAAPTAPPAADDRDAELFSTLRMLLAGRRQQQGGAPRVDNAFLAGRDDLQSVLGALQRKTDLAHGHGGKIRDAAALRHDMLAQLREASPDGRPPVLAEEDSDTVDLIGMLFDYINRSVPTQSSAQSLLARLQVPVLRVALSDKKFFTEQRHPARMLLNTIAETGSTWIDDDDVDPSLVDKMQVVVDRVSAEYNGDVGLFHSMLSDLGQHMQLIARRAEVAERRHVDAARGREKLDMARDTARTAIERLLKRGNPSPLVRTLLEQAWTDALALTILRQGEDSSAFHRRLAVADQLVRREPAAATPADAKLREELDIGLSQVGLHGDDVHAVLGRLFPSGKAANDEEAVSSTQIAMKLKARARLGGDQPPPAPRAAKPALTLSTEEKQMVDRLRSLPFGTWFEFTTNQQGSTVRRKLAWFSTLTGRCLFVNQRGARTDEKTLEQLARDMVMKQARIWTGNKDSLIDRAWKAITGTLRQLSGNETQGATA